MLNIELAMFKVNNKETGTMLHRKKLTNLIKWEMHGNRV